MQEIHRRQGVAYAIRSSDEGTSPSEDGDRGLLNETPRRGAGAGV